MKTITSQKKILSCTSLILWICISYSSQAQTIKRQCISSYGTIITTVNPVFMQTVGQPYNTLSSIGNTTSVLQGYQQPVVFKAGIDDPEFLNRINMNVYPNPAAYTVTIQSDELIENSIINIADINGKFVMSESLTEFFTYTIDCSEWENGTYIITIHDKNQNRSSLKITIDK